MLNKLILSLIAGLALAIPRPTLGLEDMASKALTLASSHKGKLVLAGGLLGSYALYKKYQKELEPYINKIKVESKRGALGLGVFFLLLKKYFFLAMILGKLEKNNLIKNESLKFLIANYLSSLSITAIFKLLKFYAPREYGHNIIDIIDRYQIYNGNLFLKALIDSATFGIANQAVLVRRTIDLDAKLNDIVKKDNIEALKYYNWFIPVDSELLKTAIIYHSPKSIKFIIEQLGVSVNDIKIEEGTLLRFLLNRAYMPSLVFFIANYDDMQVDQNSIIVDCGGFAALPINHALYYCSAKAVKNCIKQGAIFNPNYIFSFNQYQLPANRRPAIIHAVLNNKSEMVKLLLEYNADTNVVDSEGKTIYDYLEEKPELQEAANIRQILRDYREQIRDEVHANSSIAQDPAGIIAEYVV